MFGQDTRFSRYVLNKSIQVNGYDTLHPYYIVTWRESIPASQDNIVRQLDSRTAIVHIDNLQSLLQYQQHAQLYPANDSWKYSPAAEIVSSKSKNNYEDFIVSTGSASILPKIKQHRDILIISVDIPTGTLVLRTTWNMLKQHILPLTEVRFVDILQPPQTEIGIIGYNRSFHGITALDNLIPGADGHGLVVGVKEQKMESLDLDLFKRVSSSPIEASAITNHATVIASIIGGAGNSFYDGRGIAHHSRFFPSSFANLFPDDMAILNTAKVSVQNHSYGTIIQQFYGAEAVSYDVQTWENKNLLHVFSAGNQGTAAAGTGPYTGLPGFANLTGNFKMAKNVITVGAIDNKGNIPLESSSGPVYDGRIAPQLIALGPNGTSDAAAMVSGTIAVLQQVYADSNSGILPPASLVKALLYTYADDIHRSHIDYKTGYGQLNSYAAVKGLQQKNYDGGVITQSQQWTKTITVPASCAAIKITLSWTDTTSLPNNNKALIYDLDLDLTELNTGMIYKPWVLSSSPNIDSLNKLPVRKRDSLNTSEQVSIQLPAAGTYQVRITGHTIPASSISFHIAYRIDTLNTFSFISPQHTSDVNREENPELDIRWKTHVADTNTTGNLSVSFDAGVNWQPIHPNYKIYKNYYSWPVKDTNSRAVFRMQTSFGTFLSREIVIAKTTRLQVDFQCADSFRLSWNKHIYAGGYRLYTLTDSAYLKPVLMVADTFIVLNRSNYPSLVYAVQPELTNNLPASRSVAVDISLQGVQCFFRTFYYTLFDENRLELNLELSAPSYTDSITFEQVTPTGVLIRSYPAIKTNDGFLYTQLTDILPPGTSYWRVRIRLKSGAVVYTDIINVLTSGQSYVLFYPNPVRRGESLQYVLKQGVPVDSYLQLYDISGRLLLSQTELQGFINTQTFSSGIFIYKLLSRTGETLQTGKLAIIQ